jgi:hypothetical protein
MFDKDKAIGLLLHDTLPQGEQFILHGARVLDEPVNTVYGLTENAELEVARLDQPRERMKVTTVASAIVAKVKEAEPSDFPAVVLWTKVDTKAQKDVTILRFIRPLNVEREQTPAPETAATETV